MTWRTATGGPDDRPSAASNGPRIRDAQPTRRAPDGPLITGGFVALVYGGLPLMAIENADPRLRRAGD